MGSNVTGKLKAIPVGKFLHLYVTIRLELGTSKADLAKLRAENDRNYWILMN